MRSTPFRFTPSVALLLGLALSSCGGGEAETAPVSQPPPEASSPKTTEISQPAATSPAPAAVDGTPLYLTFPEGVDPVTTMYAAYDALAARPEHAAGRVKVQHILVGVGKEGAGRLPAAAEKRAAMILQALAAASGENFDELVKEHTNDAHPGIYTMLATGQPNVEQKLTTRAMMAQAFGETSWRLRVGEVGIAPYDPRSPMGSGTSPYGIHIIKRLE